MENFFNNKQLATMCFKGILFSFLLILFFGFSLKAFAAVSCDFEKDLQAGMVDEDVRCLQRYLNESGYAIASSGVGSGGHETNIFGDRTKAAVIRWQRANNLPGSGFFGPQSRAQYLKKVSASSVSASSSNPTTASLQAQVNQLLAQLTNLQNGNLVGAQGSITKSDADTAIRHAQETFDATQEDLDDFDVNDIGNAKSIMQSAQSTLNTAQNYYNNKNYKNAFEFAQKVSSLTQEAMDQVDDSEIEKRRSAQSDIKAAQNALDKARDEIKRADTINLEIGEAEDMFDDAEDMFDDAEDYFDKKEYAKASKAAQESIRLGGIALDEIEY